MDAASATCATLPGRSSPIGASLIPGGVNFRVYSRSASSDPGIEALRSRQVKNFLTTTVLSIGVPMLGTCDEVRHSQCGNNNAYCQDNDASWFDRSLVEKHADVRRFLRLLLERRRVRNPGAEQHHLSLNQLLASAQKTWHGVKIGQPDWSSSSHSIALSAHLPNENVTVHLIFNAYREPLEFELPDGNRGPWKGWIDTALDPPNDILRWLDAANISGSHYVAGPRFGRGTAYGGE